MDEVPIHELVYQHVVEAFEMKLPPPHSRQIARRFNLKPAEVADACRALIADGRLEGAVVAAANGDMVVGLIPSTHQ